MDRTSINNTDDINNIKYYEDSNSEASMNYSKFSEWRTIGKELLDSKVLLTNIKCMKDDIKYLTDNGIITEKSVEYTLLEDGVLEAMKIIAIPSKNVTHLSDFYHKYELHKEIIDSLREDS